MSSEGFLLRFVLNPVFSSQIFPAENGAETNYPLLVARTKDHKDDTSVLIRYSQYAKQTLSERKRETIESQPHKGSGFGLHLIVCHFPVSDS